ncbi:MAG: protein-L-isoaspartate(D-aspartate) O-methyltransferase [Bacteroidia bacterium]|nr:protein-L-isoaspartate(D-aspartate) O-methyltransferase [Bacteroidia bacterium]
MKDTFKHQGLRRALVKELRVKGIRDDEVLKAIEKVPRHYFFDNALLEHAYQDKAFPIGAGQTISQPYTVAYQTQLLQVDPGLKVLEIGTGSGYQTCILLEMGARVYTIERQKLLFDKTKLFLPEMGYRAHFFYGDGYLGLPRFAPFDRILVTAGAPYVPEDLLKQLVVGGILVIPVGEGAVQDMKVYTKVADNQFNIKSMGAFKFVPMLSEKAR